MDSATIIFIITILQTTLDCNGLREQPRRLQTHRRRLDDLDDFRIPRRSSFFYAGMNPSQPNVQPYPLPEKEHKTGARIVKKGNSMSITYGGNLDTSVEEFYEQDYRRANVPWSSEPALIIALLRSNKGIAPEEQLNLQNDRRTPEVDLRKTPAQDFNFTEQQRAINLLELPIARFVKDYHNIELEIQKRASLMAQERQGREIPSMTEAPIDSFLQNYDNFKEEMMQNQKRYQIIENTNKNLEKEDLLKEYETKTNEYNYNRVPEVQDPQVVGQQNRGIPIPRPQNQNVMIPRPQVQEDTPRPQLQDMSRQQADLQYLDIMGLNEDTTSRSAPGRINPEEIYNSIPNWQADTRDSPLQEPKPPNIMPLGIQTGEENDNWQATLDQSTKSLNLADMPIERLVSVYHKLEQEIIRRKEVVENYKKSMKQPNYSNQMKKPENAQKYEFFPPNRPSLSGPQGQSGRPGSRGQPGPQGSRGHPGPQGSRGQLVQPGPPGSRGQPDQQRPQGSRGQAGSPGQSDPQGSQGLLGPRDPHPTSPTRNPENRWKPLQRGSDENILFRQRAFTTSTEIPGPRPPVYVVSKEILEPKIRQFTTSTEIPGWVRILRGLFDVSEESPSGTTQYNQAYLSDSELATLFTPVNQQIVETTTESFQFDLGMESKETFSTFNQFEPETPTGIVTYPNRKSFYEPEYDQRIRPLNFKKKRRKKKPITSYQYAYVDLENLEEVIKRFRRQRAGPKYVGIVNNRSNVNNEGNVDHRGKVDNWGQVDNRGKVDNRGDVNIESRANMALYAKTRPNYNDEPDIISTDDDSAEFKPSENAQPDAKSTWFHNSRDAYNHIRIDPDAPEMADFMPKVVLQDHGNKWWFYHQADYYPFKD